MMIYSMNWLVSASALLLFALVCVSEDCRLNNQHSDSYVVYVVVKETKKMISHGSIIAYMGILTSCLVLKNYNYTDLEVVATSAIETKGVYSDFCQIRKGVTGIVKHPKCDHTKYERFFNLAVLELEEAFPVVFEAVYPNLFVPNLLDELVAKVTFVNLAPFANCEIPKYNSTVQKPPPHLEGLHVAGITFYQQCIPKICEVTNDDWRYPQEKDCVKDYQERTNYTLLCMYYLEGDVLKEEFLPKDYNLSHFVLSGAPLMCNHTALGIVTDFKIRRSLETFSEDILLVTTFIRAWEFINSYMDMFESILESPSVYLDPRIDRIPWTEQTHHLRHLWPEFRPTVESERVQDYTDYNDPDQPDQLMSQSRADCLTYAPLITILTICVQLLPRFIASC